MKKALVTLALCAVIVSQSQAVFLSCSTAITTAFTKFYTKVNLVWTQTNQQMSSKVVPNAEENLAKIKAENAILRELIAEQQAINLQQEEILFNLEKKLKMRQ